MHIENRMVRARGEFRGTAPRRPWNVSPKIRLPLAPQWERGSGGEGVGARPRNKISGIEKREWVQDERRERGGACRGSRSRPPLRRRAVRHRPYAKGVM